MNSIKRFGSVLLIGLWLMAGCSSEPETPSALVKGHITVSDSVDSSGDYSGIGITIVKRDSASAPVDTVYHQLTDSTGHFSGRAAFPGRGFYPFIISRNGKKIATARLILANRDTVTVDAELPDLSQTLNIQSKENDALKVYQRVDRAFNRVAAYANAGRIAADSLSIELEKWSGIYWSVYEKNDQTLAGKMAASEAIRLLNGFNRKEMMQKVRIAQKDEDLVNLAAGYGKDYLAHQQGLDQALAYLDSLKKQDYGREQKMRLQMERIKLLYDSARVEEATRELNHFKNQYADSKDAKQWASDISYDLTYLAPGDSIPDFSFKLPDGREISRETLMGTPYILEITTLANRMYQQQYDRTVAIYHIYKNFGLNIVTIPLDQSQVTVDAFYQERAKPWPVAPAHAFKREAILDRFNISRIPARFLVNRKGRIVRKYIGNEFEDVVKDLKTVINQTEENS